MKTINRVVSDYLHVWISGHCHTASSDGSLVREFVQHHDGDAFAELLRRHGPMVLGLSRRIVSDAQTAEDIFQATFLVLARKAHTLRRPEALAAWLHGVAGRIALRTRKAGARRRQQEARAIPAAAAPDPLAELTARELLAVLDEELQQLPENHRVPLILCGLEGLSQEEAARRLGWSAGAVKGRLERGRTRLRRLLSQRGLTLPAALAGSVLIGEWASAVPPALAAATRQAALTESAAPTVLALAAPALRTGLATKLKLAALLLGMMGVAAIGLGWQHGQAPPGDPPAAPAPALVDAPATGEQVDATLPDGAVLRLGTVECRAVGARLALSADGKTIIGVRGSRYVHVWDAATGRLEERHELAQPESFGPVGGIDAVSPHGRFFATEEYTGRSLRVWDVLSGKIIRDIPVGDGTGGGAPGGGRIGVNAVAFSPDERVVAAILGTRKQTALRAWEVKTGKAILDTEIAARGWSELLMFTPDGKRLLVADDAGLAAYDVAGATRCWHAKNVPTAICDAFLGDGKLLLQDGGIHVVDLATGKIFPFENGPPRSWDGPLAVTPDRKTLLVGGADAVLVWDLVAGKAIRTLAGGGETMLLAPDAATLVTSNGAIQRWNLATGKPLYADTFAQGHVGEVVAIAFSGDGKKLASGSTDGTVRLWDAATGKPLQIWRGHEPVGPLRRLTAASKIGVTALDISPDGSRVVSAGGVGNEPHLLVWDAVTGKRAHMLSLPTPVARTMGQHVTALRIRAAGTRVMAVIGAQSWTGTIGEPPIDTRPRLATWDLKTGELVTSVPVKGYAAAFAARGNVLVGEGVVTDAATGRQQARLAKTVSEWPEPAYAVSADGLLIATGLAQRGKTNGQDFIGPRGGALWEACTGQRVAQFPTQSWVASLAMHPDGRHVAVNDLDDITLVDVPTGKIVASFRMPEKIRAGTTPGSYASCLAFSPDGRRLATGHPDGNILVWEIKLPADQPAPLGAGEADALWADLANANAARAWRAVWRLREHPEAALERIVKHVAPVLPAPAAVTGPMLADLDSEIFATRESAMTGLRKLGIRAAPALDAHLGEKISLEAKRRVTALLKEITDAPPGLTPESLAQVRALAVLAHLRAPKSRQLLERLAGGVRLAPLTRAAQAALGR
jgi:RNA polymerase sigma factor (sigma-70 family)